MRIRVSLIAMAVLALVSVGSAQQGGGGGGRRGGFGQGMRGGMGGQRLTGLLRSPQVQEELKLTDDQKAKIDALPRPQRGPGGGGGQRPTPPTPEEQAKQLADDKAATSAILTPEQEARLEQLRIQWAGPSALGWPDVQAALALSDDQKAKVKDLQDKMAEANRQLFDKVRNQEIERADAMATMQNNQNTLKTEIDKVLTDDQKAKLKAMGGVELKMEMRRPGGGRNG